MKRSMCVVTSVLVAAAMLPGFTVAQADNGNHYGSDKQNPQHSQNAKLTRYDHDRDDNNGKHGKHTDGENQNQRHNQNAQLTRYDHDRDDNNGKHGKHTDGENQDQRHNQNAQLTRYDHDRDDNNGKHIGWDKHLGNPTGDWTNHYPPASVPEPASLILLGAGIAGIGFLRRMSRKA